ncbi:DUF397 domain-containing protein [Streptomyces sp. DH41]|nr:DUF397 domain-containing protein [Streptomyces sp. DH41]MDG9722224.1 DUF397 domain-containing protein [Streptomyces sp. DH41]
MTPPGTIPVRDSKNTDGPVLTLTAQAWVPCTNGLKGDSL